LLVGRPGGRVALRNACVGRADAEGQARVAAVRAGDVTGRAFLVEMQRLAPTGLAKRLLYYWAGGHAEQLLRGERYEMLQPTYLICLLNEALLQDGAYHRCFRPYDAENGVLLCRDLEIHLLELST